MIEKKLKLYNRIVSVVQLAGASGWIYLDLLSLKGFYLILFYFIILSSHFFKFNKT